MTTAKKPIIATAGSESARDTRRRTSGVDRRARAALRSTGAGYLVTFVMARGIAQLRSVRHKLLRTAVPALADVVPRRARLDAIVKDQADAYRHASPFPHVVLDELFDERLLTTIASEFPPLDGRWHETDALHEVKRSIEDERLLGPSTRQLVHALNTSTFVTFLERLTGIEGLLVDPHFRGGGLHQIFPGGFLGIHQDFNLYPRLRVYRRLNIIVYLNKDWQEEWGGHLELWNPSTGRCEKRVLPLFNRTVLFDTSPNSWHGHPHPLTCPADRSRKSLALYYYSVDYPHEEDLHPHSTIFQDLGL
jgi:Rps23 Pro-64 3,4-dihydroxylase Tpa1-like proline 4-hydroxylase